MTSPSELAAPADTPAPSMSALPLTAHASASSPRHICGRPVTVSGRLPSIAKFADEEWNELPEIADPAAFITALQKARLSADLFSFAEPLGCTEPRFADFRIEWDNAAAVPLSSFKEWWEERLP